MGANPWYTVCAARGPADTEERQMTNDYRIHIDMQDRSPKEYGYGHYYNATHNNIVIAWEKVSFGSSDEAHEAAKRRVRARARYALKKDGYLCDGLTWI